MLAKKTTDVSFPDPSESDIEASITTFLAAALPESALSFHVSNEGKRGWAAQSQFLKAGGRAGIPDRIILWKGRAWFLEAKRRTGRLSETQRETFPLVEAAGCSVAVVRSLDDAERALRTWGLPLRASVLGLPLTTEH